jgi:YVTN family beta-propeller protein
MARVRAAGAALLILLATVATAIAPAQAQAVPTRNERVYVANSGSDTVSVIDADTNAVIATIPVGDRPTGVLAVGSRVYVTNQASNTVSVIDVATNSVIDTVAVGVRPGGLDVDAYGDEVWVANEGSNTVSVIDIAIDFTVPTPATNDVVATVPVGIGPHGLTFSAHGEQIYVTSQPDTVTVVDDYDHDVAATVPVGHTPADIEAPPQFNDRVYVTNQSSNSVSVINRASDTVVKTIPVGADPSGLVSDVFTGRLFVANKGSNTISVIAMGTDTVADTWSAVHPHELAVSVLGNNRMYATGMGGAGGVVTVLDLTTGAVVATVPVGDFPEGVATAAVPPPVISGQTWYASGAKSATVPAGSQVSLYAAGAVQGVPYQLTLSLRSDWPCLFRAAVLNPTVVEAGPNGVIGRVRGTIPPGTPAGTYTVCFRHTAGSTATGVVNLTVT